MADDQAYIEQRVLKTMEPKTQYCAYCHRDLSNNKGNRCDNCGASEKIVKSNQPHKIMGRTGSTGPK